MNNVDANNAIQRAQEVAARVKGAAPVCEPRPECGWLTVYHPSGLQVKLPVADRPLDYGAMFANVSAALAAGFLVAAPGLEAGEEKESIGFVLLRSKVNNDRSESKVVDLYATTGLMYKKISIYLDTPDDALDFEKASGMKLAHLKEYPGSGSPKRGDNPKSDAFIIRAPKPFEIVLKPNPKYNPDESDPTKKKPQWEFVRWCAPAAAPGAEISPRDTLAGKFRSAKSHADYLTVCEEIKAGCADKRLSEEDRLWLRTHAEDCLKRCPAPQK